MDNDQEFTTSGATTTFGRTGLIEDLTDGDGNGELVADDEIHISILGSGNANAKRVRGYFLYHLIELDPTEALFELIETNL